MLDLEPNALNTATRDVLDSVGLGDLFDSEEEFLGSCSQCEHHGEEGELGSERLHNQKPPGIAVKHERFWHRKLAFMVASGMSAKECAEELEKTVVWVRQVMRQPWFTKMVLGELQRCGKSAVDEIFKNAAPASALKLIEIRDDETAPASVRLKAADTLLDRYLGKAPQTIKHDQVEQIDDPVAEAARLEQELELVRK